MIDVPWLITQYPSNLRKTPMPLGLLAKMEAQIPWKLHVLRNSELSVYVQHSSLPLSILFPFSSYL
ncbi:unnamed protein product [Gongylonema pulchrum]|uniref:Ovule protein n=1 Tax=Gongylonema pulchrum TaxID=637853 RepID=A0A183E3W4_9BILA|nr:unnamed protein product [Gongylonema pulchrum]